MLGVSPHLVFLFLVGDWYSLRLYVTFDRSHSSRHVLTLLSKADGALEPHSVHTQFPEPASGFIVLNVFTWSSALAAKARDLVLTACLTSLAISSTIARCLFAYNGGTSETSGSDDGEVGGVTMGIKAASYF